MKRLPRQENNFLFYNHTDAYLRKYRQTGDKKCRRIAIERIYCRMRCKKNVSKFIALIEEPMRPDFDEQRYERMKIYRADYKKYLAKMLRVAMEADKKLQEKEFSDVED